MSRGLSILQSGAKTADPAVSKVEIRYEIVFPGKYSTHYQKPALQELSIIQIGTLFFRQKCGGRRLRIRRPGETTRVGILDSTTQCSMVVSAGMIASREAM